MPTNLFQGHVSMTLWLLILSDSDAGRGCGWWMKGSDLDQRRAVFGPALTKTAPAQLHLWLPSLRWSPRQTWSCSCGWSHCWSASGSQSCSVRGGETDLGSDSKSGITAKYNPGLSHRDRTVGQWWHKQRADTKAPQHDLILKTLTHHQSIVFWTHVCKLK